MAENKIDILLRSLYKSDGINKAMQDLSNLQKKAQSFSKLTEQAGRAGLVPTVSKDGILTFQNLAGATQNYDKSMQKITKTQTAFDEQMARTKAMTDKVNAAMVEGKKASMATMKANKEQQMALEKLGNTFSMEFLGILFFGMQIKLLFESLAKSTVSSFMKITEGATSSGQAISALNAVWTLLSFTIGGAIASVLETLLPILMPIIEAITDWVEQHPKLVGWLVILGIVVGTVMLIVGSLAIGLEAVWNAMLKVGAGTSILNKALMSWLAPVAAEAGWVFVFTTIAMWIGIIIAIVIVLYAAWVTNFGGIRDYTTETLGIIWDLIKTVFGGIWEIIKTVLDIVVAIFEGNWNLVLKLLGKVIIQILSLITKLGAQILSILYNTFTYVVNLILNSMKSILKLLTGFVSGSYQLMFTFAQNVIKFIAKPFDWIANKINAAISVLSTVPTFGWVSKFKIPNSGQIIDTLGDVKDGIEQIEQAGNSVIDDVFKNRDFISRDSVAGFTDMVDRSSKKLVDMLNIPEKITAGPVAKIENPLASFDTMSSSLASFSQQSQLASQSSQSMVLANQQETASWEDKNASVLQYIETLKQANSMSTMLKNNDMASFDRSVGNFVVAPR